MNEFSERQMELLLYLNDNMLEPDEHISEIADIFDIVFIDNDEAHGWIIKGTTL